MTAREKVIMVEEQIRKMVAGEQTEFSCPFCCAITTEGNGILCCGEAAGVVLAVLDHIEHLKSCEIVEQVMNRFSAAETKIILN